MRWNAQEGGLFRTLPVEWAVDHAYGHVLSSVAGAASLLALCEVWRRI